MKKITQLIILLFVFSLIPIIGQTSATYDITFTSFWNASDHTSLPVNAHWSKLVGVTHKTTNAFLQIGDMATTGIKNIAETGNNTVFNTEVTTVISNGEADQYINGPNLGVAAGDILISNLLVSKEFPLLTLVSMIAPSPDWIIALNGYSLLDAEGNWKASARIDMFAYDAGTDSGIDYTSDNIISNPFQPITMINGSPLNGKKTGALIIEQKTILDENDFLIYNKINVYPNPVSNEKIIISNLENISLKKVEVFNVYGLLMKSFYVSVQHSNLVLDVQDLESGLYIMKLNDDLNKAITRKFMIE